MTENPPRINLTNHFLIAMPGLEDAMFSKSVVYVFEHSARGALGLVINKPAGIAMAGLFEKIELPLKRPDLTWVPVLQGGPVQTGKGFVLYEDAPDALRAASQPYDSTMAIPGGLSMTTSKDILEELSNGFGPHKVRIFLGCSSWKGGQLESELCANSWLTVDADWDLIFSTPPEQRYDKALALLGVQVSMISSQVGHA